VSTPPETLPLTPGPSTGDDAARPRIGRYILRGELGRGGMGVVFRAWDPNLRREVALKVLRDALLADDSGRLRMQREAAAVARIRHPGIVEVYDYGEEDGHAYLTMRLVRGQPLSAPLQQGALPARAAARIAVQVARALQHAHELGLVHRDVKPGNILLEGEVAVLSDFGLVKEAESGDAPLTRDTQLLGTPGYMAPEQVRDGVRASSPASDQYALGVVLFQMLKGWPPYYGATPMETWRRILKEDPPPLKGEGVPPDLAIIAVKAMSRHPEDRYPSAGAMAEDLDRFLAGERVLAGRPPLRRRVNQALRRHRGRLVVGGLSAAIALFAFFGSDALSRLWAWREAAQREEEAETRRAALDTRLNALEAQGQAEEADRLFSLYAQFDGNAETDALARAWLDQAARLDRRADTTQARIARATAYALASALETQTRALLELAAGYDQELDWDRLSRALRTIDRGPPLPEARERIQIWRRDLAVGTHDLERARTLTTDPEERAFLDALAQVGATNVSASTVSLVDVDRDGRRELVTLSPGRDTLSVVEPDPELTLRASYSTGDLLRDQGPLLALGPASTPPLLAERAGGGCTLLDLVNGALMEVQRLPCTLPRAAVNADIDGDGTPETYVADDRTLERLTRGPDGYRLERLEEPTSASNSEIWTLMADDLDDDGRVELVATTADWGAYDARVLRGDAGGLHLVTRKRLGQNFAAAILHDAQAKLLAVAQAHDPHLPLSRQQFGADTPHGAAQGIHLLRDGPGGLEEVGLLPLPTPTFATDGPMFAPDLDGDGDSDLALGHRPHETLLEIRRSNGGFTQLALSGFQPETVLDLDRDGDDELVVSDASRLLWVFGSGAALVPILPPASVLAHRRSQPPPGSSESLARSWERAEDLVDIGLPDVAADRFAGLAELATGGEAEGAARYRAAEILEDTGMLRDAGEQYRLAADRGAHPGPALESAFYCFARDRRWEEALVAGRARLALPDAPEDLRTAVADLERDAAHPPLIYDLSRDLPTGLELLEPLDASWGTDAAGLELRAVGPRSLLRAAVRPVSDHVSLSLTLRVEQMDWGTVLTLGRRAGDAAGFTDWPLRLASGGGGGVLTTWLGCDGTNDYISFPRGDLDLSRPVTLVWEQTMSTGEGTCALVQGGVELRRKALRATAHPGPLPGAPAWLELDSIGEATLQDVRLQRLELSGYEAVDLPADPLAEVNLALAHRSPQAALDLLDARRAELRGDPRALLARALALAGLGRGGEAGGALSALLGGGDARQDLAAIMLVRPDDLGPLARRALGSGFAAPFEKQLESAIAMRADDPAITRLLTHMLDDVDLPTGRERTAMEMDDSMSLLFWRGRAYLLERRHAEALRDLERALGLAQALYARPRLDVSLRQDLARMIALVWVSLARMSWERNDPTTAFADLQRALAASPSPQTHADALAVDPWFAGMRALPGWSVIEAARTRGDALSAPAQPDPG